MRRLQISAIAKLPELTFSSSSNFGIQLRLLNRLFSSICLAVYRLFQVTWTKLFAHYPVHLLRRSFSCVLNAVLLSPILFSCFPFSHCRLVIPVRTLTAPSMSPESSLHLTHQLQFIYESWVVSSGLLVVTRWRLVAYQQVLTTHSDPFHHRRTVTNWLPWRLMVLINPFEDAVTYAFNRQLVAQDSVWNRIFKL